MTAVTGGRVPDTEGTPTAPSPVVVDRVEPCVDGGRHAAKGIVGDTTEVEVVMFAHGHEEIAGRLHVADPTGATAEYALTARGNDRWTASFVPDRLGTWRYSVEAWPDPYATWAAGYERRRAAGTTTALDRADGAALVEAAATATGGADGKTLARLARALRDAQPDTATFDRIALLMRRHPDRTLAVRSTPELRLEAHRHRARCSAWYELFPRSTGPRPGTPGTLRDCIRRLPYVAELGFDVLYLPPIHPIGVTNRKGRNNATRAEPGDPGSPWAIGAAAGGHTAIAPELGTLADFAELRLDAEAHGIELALDLAFQCSPDHPWVAEHPDWFAHRSDGSIKYAENPPKRYEDVLPLDFGGAGRAALWEACLAVTRTWIARGVRIFRVDNPHTKPFAFWAWMLAEIHRTDPDVLFLAEAFTRPAVMDELAKIGFHQSYTYFTWRESRVEIEEYFTELTRGPQRFFFRPNVWPNTPDILPEHLQHGGRAMFVTRLVLAAGLAASYGIYGPVFELGLHVPREPGSEEYLHSEKYEVHHWDLDAPQSLRGVIGRMNAIRRRHVALQYDTTLHFHGTDNDRFVCWSKRDPQSGDAVLCIVNLDPDFPQEGWTDLDVDALGIEPGTPFEVEDLLGGSTHRWQGRHNYVRLDPKGTIAHVFAVRAGDERGSR